MNKLKENLVMEKIIVLGTGTASVVENYNTCFTLQNNKGNYLDRKSVV